MKITNFLVATFLFVIGFVYGSEIEEIEERLNKQKIVRIGSWCSVPWHDGWYSAEIVSFEKDQVKARVLDSKLPVSDWKESIFNFNDIQQSILEKHESIEELVDSLKENHTLVSSRIEEAFRLIDRSYFAPYYPYFDAAVEIGCDMCMSAPHIHVWCLELVKDLFENATAILDVGTGTGYLAAILGQLSPHAQIIGIEYYEDLIKQAEKNCVDHLPKSLIDRIHWETGNGEEGFYEQSPYDIIIVGFMCQNIPEALLDQLKPGGRLIIPIGNKASSYDNRLLAGSLYQVDRDKDGSFHVYQVFTCSFVPSQAK